MPSNGCDALVWSRLRRSAEGLHLRQRGFARGCGSASKLDHCRQTGARVSSAVTISGLPTNMLAQTRLCLLSQQFRCASQTSTELESTCCPTPEYSPCAACRRVDAAQRVFNATAWLYLQARFGSLSSCPLRIVHETRAAHYLQQFFAGDARGTYVLFGRCLRRSLLPRRRDPLSLFLRWITLQDMPSAEFGRNGGPCIIRDSPWKADRRQLIAVLAPCARTPGDLAPRRRGRPAQAEVSVHLDKCMFSVAICSKQSIPRTCPHSVLSRLFFISPSLIHMNSRGLTQSNSLGCTNAALSLQFAHIGSSFSCVFLNTLVPDQFFLVFSCGSVGVRAKWTRSDIACARSCFATTDNSERKSFLRVHTV